jgi:hypothetical protein
MKFPDTLLSGSYALFAVMSKMCSRFAKIVVYAWVNTSVQSANSLMMRQRSSSTIVILVEFAEVEDVIISSIVTVVAAATQMPCKMDTLVLRSLCTRTALCALRYCYYSSPALENFHLLCHPISQNQNSTSG